MKALKLIVAVLFVLLLTNVAPSQEKKYPVDISKEMGMPQGATLMLEGEFSSPLAGYAKVQCVRLTLKPGAKIDNFIAPAHAFCNLVKGQLHAVTPDGKEKTVKAGTLEATWVDPKGFTYKLIHNPGKTPAEDVMFMLIEEAK